MANKATLRLLRRYARTASKAITQLTLSHPVVLPC